MCLTKIRDFSNRALTAVKDNRWGAASDTGQSLVAYH